MRKKATIHQVQTILCWSAREFPRVAKRPLGEFWIFDDTRGMITSANMDWKSLSQVPGVKKVFGSARE
ncbi:unnamed protein product [Prorocentrum cordatum]|uniref:CDP-diacylglycerol--glycerol-3-phosphate 3-phosphatidyltransferase n=1 Tax=Prorocentrum cordatum TaxID=2364126 RepID=A0ABN9TIB0_9DINO|nr:unnamed protein product [Polarella glacialis]